MTRLDQLNKYLSENRGRLGLQPYHAHVDRSGSNLCWLRKACKKWDVPDDVRALINTSIETLLKDG